MCWSGKLLAGTLLIGFGIFNLVEGIIDHHVLGIHHVNETVPRDQWIWWDLGFLIWGAAMLVGRLAPAEERAPGNTRRNSPYPFRTSSPLKTIVP